MGQKEKERPPSQRTRSRIGRGRKARSTTEPIEMGGVIVHPGSRIGNYIFLREVGSGGMARVLLAKDPGGQLVALKVLRKSRFKTGLHRFRREFRALSRVNHPNVIRVEAYGDLFGHPYIAMEFVDGPDLHSLIRQFRSWDPQDRWLRVEEILIDLCRALSAVHRRGLVHRDLKPSNVLISADGVCKLTDFGIVKDLDPSQDPMLSTTLVGTWAYASPEQITGNPIDHRSDLYSLGVILFAMLTGKRPFVANDMAGYLALHRDRPAPAPRDVDRQIPEHLDEICRRLLQKASRDRYQSAQEILYRLEAEERVVHHRVDANWEPALVGRQLEIEAITDAVSGLTARRGGVVVLEGDDGTGKSRLIEVALDRSRSLGIPCNQVEFMGDETAFGAIITLAKHLQSELGTRSNSDFDKVISDFAADAETQGQTRYSLYDGTKDALNNLLADGPRLMLLDDIHRAHPRFIEFLTYLVRTAVVGDWQPMLFVVSTRHKASGSADAFSAGEELGFEPKEITVGALSRSDLARIVSDLVGDSLPSRLLAQRLHKETEGNAFFVVEFLRALMSNSVIKKLPNGTRELMLSPDEIATGHLEIPLGVRQMMKSRLQGITTEDRRTLEVLALGGREVDLDVLLDVLEADEETVLDSLDHLLAAGIIRERRAGELTLHAVTHRKFADVVYRDMHSDRRATLHRRMAAALELHYSQNPAALEVVGEHYRRAGDAGRAYRYLVAAAKRLQARSLMQEAWSLTEKAGAIAESAMSDLSKEDFRAFRRDALNVRAQVLFNRAEWTEAEQTFLAVLRMATEDGDPRAACEARLHLAQVLRRMRRLDESRALAQASLDEARHLHFRQGVAEALHCMASLAWSDGNLEETERMANEGLLVAQGPELAEQRAELLLALTAAQATRGRLASATSGLTQAESIFRELRKKRHRCLALANLAELLTWQGEPVQARQRAHVACQLATDLDYRVGRSVAQRAMGVAALDLGLYDEARESLLDSLLVARQINLPEEVLSCKCALSHLHLERGDLANAARNARLGLVVAEQRDPERYIALLHAHLAQAVGPRRPTEARVHLQAAEDIVNDLPVPRRTQVQLALAWAWLALDEPDQSRRHARSVLQLAGSRGFRLLSLEARALMAHLTIGSERQTHQAVGLDLVRDFGIALSDEMRRAFARRPFLRFLGQTDEQDDVTFDEL
ncbi:MAG: tetratricopeptide (TPR) repeat protein [Kiritimatiellia bacterium]|jgi:tetratricopeptide (TPR) repeat protein